MIFRILFYLLGLFLTSLGLTLIIIYLSFNNVGYSFFKNLSLIIKNPSTYMFIIGLIISLTSLFYDLLKLKK